MKKLCTKCKQLKSLDEFGKKNKSKPELGLRYHCNECVRTYARVYQRIYHKQNIEKRRAYFRAHPKKKKKTAKIKIRARDLVSFALKRGDLKKEPCSVCGDKKSEAHHNDYKKPLEVVWFCSTHHKRWHSKYKE